MNAIQEVKDESIRKVAQTLRASGLAMSETEAIRMAQMMSKTSQKVTQNFEQKKTNPNISSSHFNESGNATTPVTYRSPLNNNASSSVQEKPRKIVEKEEKEEFIFGDGQEQSIAQKKDVYSVNNEFEEVVSQDLISTKPLKEVVEGSVPSPVAAAQTQTAPVAHVSSKVESKEPVSAQGSSQMAFSFMLGAAQKNAAYEEEIRKHTPQPTASTQEKHEEVQSKPVEMAKPVAAQPKPLPAYNHNPRPFPQPAPHVPVQRPVPQALPTKVAPVVNAAPVAHAVSEQKVVEHVAPQAVAKPVSIQAPIQGAGASPAAAISPQKKMMMEANVDISKMFNFNK